MSEQSQFAIVADATAKIQEWIAGHMHCAVSELAQAEIGRRVNAAVDAVLRTRPAPTIDEDSAVAVLQRIVNRDWSCPCKGHGSSEAALLCYVTSELQSRPQPVQPAIDDAIVERIWRAVVAENHEGCELNPPSDCSLYDAIREALKGGAS